MTGTLQGRTVALAESRQLSELAEMFESQGARVIACPLIRTIDAPDPIPVLAWLRELSAGQMDLVIFLTGEGVRRLLAAADRAGIRGTMLAVLSRTRIVTRGPKPGQALKEVGLAPAIVAPKPTTEGIVAVLGQESLAGKVVGVQMAGTVTSALVEALNASGAIVKAVLPYVYAPAADIDSIVQLLEQAAAGRIDVLVFTSAPQVHRLYEVITERQLENLWAQCLCQIRIAAVGPVVAESLKRHGARVDICPAKGFVMRNLVEQIGRACAAGGLA